MRGIPPDDDTVAAASAERSTADLLAQARRVAVLEAVNDHENLGALFRNAAALGVDGVLLGAGCADPLYRRSVRVSMGTVFQVPWTRIDPWPAGVESLRVSAARAVRDGFDGSAGRIADTIKGFKEIVDGKHDDIPEQAFYMVGPIEKAVEKAKKLAAQ